jgi:hypothetical protein
MQTWGDARAAVGRFDIALNGWSVIAHALNLPPFKLFGALALGDPPVDELPSGSTVVWSMARIVKEPLRLAHPDEYRQRVARLQSDRAAAVVHAAEQADAVSAALGREEIRLKNGAVIAFPARTRQTLRGWSVDAYLADEAQFITNEQWASAKPAMAARRGSQTWMAGTAPGGAG